jgi:hypothetical protein
MVFDPSYYNVAFNYYFRGSYQNLSENPDWTRAWLVTPLPPSKSSMKLHFDSLYIQTNAGQSVQVANHDSELPSVYLPPKSLDLPPCPRVNEVLTMRP